MGMFLVYYIVNAVAGIQIVVGRHRRAYVGDAVRVRWKEREEREGGMINIQYIL